MKTPTFDDESTDNELEPNFDFRPALAQSPKYLGRVADTNQRDHKSVLYEKKYSEKTAGTSKSSQNLSNETGTMVDVCATMTSELDKQYIEPISKSKPDPIEMSNDMSFAFSRMGNELGINLNDVLSNSESNGESKDMSNDLNIAFSKMGNELGIDMSGIFPETQIKSETVSFSGGYAIRESKSSSTVDLKTSNPNKNQRIGRPAGPKRRTDDVAVDEKMIELEISSPPVSPRSEKRREIPELSPNRSESGDEVTQEEILTISGALKQKGRENKKGGKTTQTYKKSSEKYRSENSGELVSQYFTSTPQLNLESVNLGESIFVIFPDLDICLEINMVKKINKNLMKNLKELKI